MPEIRETGQYQIAYDRLQSELQKYDLTREELDNYIYLLLDELKNRINSEGKIPEYSYIINPNLPLIYEFDRNNYLEILCGFDPVPEYVDDMATNGPIIIPKSASARMNLTSGEYDVAVTWHEIFSENN